MNMARSLPRGRFRVKERGRICLLLHSWPIATKLSVRSERCRPPVPRQKEAVEDGASESGLTDDIVPVLHGELGGKNGSRAGVAVVKDFEDGFEARFGALDVTTDQMTGGAARANVAVRDGALPVTDKKLLRDSSSP